MIRNACQLSFAISSDTLDYVKILASILNTIPSSTLKKLHFTLQRPLVSENGIESETSCNNASNELFGIMNH